MCNRRTTDKIYVVYEKVKEKEKSELHFCNPHFLVVNFFIVTLAKHSSKFIAILVDNQ